MHKVDPYLQLLDFTYLLENLNILYSQEQYKAFTNYSEAYKVVFYRGY